jgi:hypothetical protein
VSASDGRRGREIGLAVAWVAVVLVFWFGLFVPNQQAGLRRPIDIDLVAYFHPKFWYGNAELLAGRLPLWNPYEYCGIPFLATAQPAAVYPLKILAYAVAPGAGLHVFMVLHYLLAGPFAFVALRGLGLGWTAAALGTVAWVFTATNLDSNFHPNRISCVVWIPLAFLCFARLLERPGARTAAALAVVIALAVLAGYPEYAFDTVLALVVYWPFAARALARRGVAPPLGKTVGWLAVSAGTALALAALQLLPTIELVRESARVAGITATAPKAPVLPPLSELLPGSLAGLQRGLTLPIRALHVPAIAWVLAVIGTFFGRGPARAPMLAVLVVTTALASTARILLQLVPGLGLLRPNYCWLALWYFAIAYMAASGLEAILSRADETAHAPWSRRRVAVAAVIFALSALLLAPRSAVTLAVGLALLAVATWVRAWRTPATLVLTVATIVSAWTWITPAISGEGLVHRYSRGEPSYPPEPPVSTGLRDAVERACGRGQRVLGPWLAWDGAGVRERLELAEGYPEPLVPGRIDRLVETLGIGGSPVVGPAELARAAAHIRFLDMLNVGCAVLPAGVEWPGIGLTRVGSLGDQVIYTRPALPRAWVVHRTRAAPDSETAWEMINEPAFDPAVEVVLEGARDTTGTAGTARATVEREETGQLEITLSTPTAGTLVVAQSYYPGWHARVDGASAEVLPANFGVTGVPVPAGEHRVVLSYAPASVRAAKLLVVVGLLVLGGLVLGDRRRGEAVR